MSPEELDRQNKLAIRRGQLAKIDPISYDEMVAVFQKWMIMPNPEVLKLLAAFYVANRFTRKAVWLFMIAASGGGKTEILNSFIDLPDIVEISLITPNTFLSGMPGPRDASLLPKLTGKIMMVKDWTTTLSMQSDALQDVMGQLRSIWDGYMKKVFGNGKTREWSGKVSLLAASTEAVDMSQQRNTHMGERFMNYRLYEVEPKTVARRSLDNNRDSEKMSIELRDAVYAYMKGLNLKELKEDTIPELPEEIKDQLVSLANFAVRARSGVIRDFGMKKEVLFVPRTEVPTRFVGQLATLGAGLMVCNGGQFKEEDMKILYKCALDSIPQTNKMVITEMAKADNQTTAEIATALNYPTETIRMYLENLALLKVCKRFKDAGKADRWTMEGEYADIIRHYEGVTELTQEELDSRKLEANGGVDEDYIPEGQEDVFGFNEG